MGEDLKIADKVAGNETDKHQTGGGHEKFPADRRAKKRTKEIHREWV
jgi:hypothetical protein